MKLFNLDDDSHHLKYLGVDVYFTDPSEGILFNYVIKKNKTTLQLDINIGRDGTSEIYLAKVISKFFNI